jgi:hypothetical protein
MLVNRLGQTPLRLEARFDLTDISPPDLGSSIRHAISVALPWVEWEEFEQVYMPLGEPVSRALGIKNKDLNKADRESGKVSIEDWPDDQNYDLTAWVSKGTSGKPIDKDYSPLPKNCINEQLGSYVLACLGDSLDETLMVNAKRR